MAAAGGVLVALIMQAAAPGLALLLGARGAVYAGSTGYLRASTAGVPFMYLPYAGNGHLIGLADTPTKSAACSVPPGVRELHDCAVRPQPPRELRWVTLGHAVVVSVLTPAEILIAARRLAGARPHLAAVAGLVHHEDLWQLWCDELTGESTSASTAGISAATGSAWSSGPRRGPGSCGAARRSHGA